MNTPLPPPLIAAKAILFDLFGTLVGSLSQAALKRVLVQMAQCLGIEGEGFARSWVATFNQRAVAVGTSVEKTLGLLCDDPAVRASSPEGCQSATQLWLDFMRASLTIKPGVLATLSQLRIADYRLGLVSDCSAEVPSLWNELPIAPFIDAPIFSCRVGLKKPDPRIFRLASEALGVRPEQCVYVADGSSGELRAARSLGMEAILLRWADEDPADAFRIGAEDWNGPAISSLEEILRWLRPAAQDMSAPP